MTPPTYPERDRYWIASDRIGNVGLFFTAGKGPIPLLVIEQQWSRGAELESAIATMSEISEFQLFYKYNKPDDFVATARAGLFAYDWLDVHRSPKTRQYELVAAPTTPLKIDRLSATLRRMAQGVVLNDSVFGRDARVAIVGQIESIEWQPTKKQ